MIIQIAFTKDQTGFVLTFLGKGIVQLPHPMQK